MKSGEDFDLRNHPVCLLLKSFRPQEHLMDKRLLKFFIVLALNTIALTFVMGQTYVMNPSQPLLTSCSGFFYDSGGENGNYTGNQHFATTICSPNSTGQTHINLFLNNASVDINPGDVFCFYDGVDTLAPLIGCVEDFSFLDVFNIQATAANSSGCITVHFVSQSGSSAAGWQSTISCVNPCQPVLVSLDTLNTSPLPTDSTGYLDICPGQTITVSAEVSFPQNGEVYNQSPFTSTYVWDFGDGTIKYGLTANHTYNNPGGYMIDLTVTDSIGCKNANYLGQKVRVSTYPEFAVGNYDDVLCLGDTVHLTASGESGTGSSLVFTAVEGGFPTGAIVYDSLALPDGSGVSYTSSITFTDFNPSQSITSAQDLESICLNMEHSYMGDLSISITCPSGQMVMLKTFGAGPGGGGNGTILGEPVATNLPVDGSGGSLAGIPGIGYDYCFASTATSGYFTDPVNWTNVSPYTDPIGNVSNNSTIWQANAGTYLPAGNFNNLIGCPLNGDWTLTVTDHLFLDDGFIFYWTIHFLPSLYPSAEIFLPEFVDFTWLNNSSVIYNSGDTLIAIPQVPGSASYTFEVTDNFGCTFDTTLIFQVLAPTDPECLNCGEQLTEIPDTSICLDLAGTVADTISLDVEIPGMEFIIPYTNANQTAISGNPVPVNNPLKIPITVSGLQPASFSTNNFISVCLNIDIPFPTDLHLSLEAPNGTVILLKNTGSLSGFAGNYTNTCFTPDATTVFPTNNALAPFTGNWLPQQTGGWNNLNGVPVNGTWYLRIANPSLTFPGAMLNWSITFSADLSYTYSWSPANGISCIDCPQPSFYPDQTTTYTLNVLNNYGCTEEQSFTLAVGEYFDPPLLQCGPPSPTGVSVLWPAVPGAGNGYVVSIDGDMPWITNDTFVIVEGLLPGESVTISVAVVSECDVPAAVITCTAIECDLEITVIGSEPLLCTESQDGIAWAAADFGVAPYTFNWSGPVSVSGDTAANLSAGMYWLTVTDSLGCIAIDSVTITAPDDISFSVSSLPATCEGIADGQAWITNVSNAVGVLTVNWPGGLEGDSITGLFSGYHFVSVTDENGCMATDSFYIDQPETLQSDSIIVINTSCSGYADGEIHVYVSGGNLPYSYTWGNPGIPNSALVQNITAGEYSLTVTDVMGCELIVTGILVDEPEVLSVDVNTADVLCHGDASGYAWAAVNGGTWPYTIIWSSGVSPVADSMVSDLNAGWHSVMIVDSQNCSDTVSFEINEPAEVMQLSYTSTDAVCYGEASGNIQVMANGGTSPYFFNWDTGQETGDISDLSAGSYAVTVTDANNCADTIIISVLEPDELNLSGSVTGADCYGAASGQAEVSATGGTFPYTYEWDDPALQTGSIATMLSAGSYTAVVTDAQGCTAYIELIIEESPPLSIDIQINDAACNGSQDGSAMATPSGGAEPYSFSWSNGQTGSSMQAGAGVYSVTVSDQNGCTQIAEAIVGEPAAITATYDTEPALCFGETTGTATVTATGGTGPYSYFWSDPGSQTTSQALQLSAGNYQVTVTDSQLCEHVVNVQVSGPVFPVSATLETKAVSCYNGQDGTVTVVPHGGTMPYSYTWSFGPANSPDAINLSPGLVSVTVTDANGCTTEVSAEVFNPEPVSVSVENTSPAKCFNSGGGAATAIVSGGTPGQAPNPAYQFQWNTSPPQTGAMAINLNGGQTYQVTVTDAAGCSATGNVIIAQPEPLTLEVHTLATQCYGTSDGTATATAIQGGTAPFTFQWSAAAGLQTSQVAAGLPAGQYTVTVTDSQGCTGKASGTVTQPPAIVPALNLTHVACKGSADGVASVQATGGYAPYQFQWSDGSFGQQSDNLSAGNYDVTVTDALGCTHQASFSITEPENDLVISAYGVGVSCAGESNGRIHIHAEGGVPGYVFSIDGSQFSEFSSFGQLQPGSYTVWVRDHNGCSDTVSVWVEDGASFMLIGESEYMIQEGEAVGLTVQINGTVQGDLQYQWTSSNPADMSCTSCPAPVVTPAVSTYFTVIVTDENGCIAYFTVKVEVEQRRNVYVPNAFTPNFDEVNDRLIIHGPEDMIIRRFQVFDRWGGQVFLAIDIPPNQYEFGWDGSFAGKELQSGVFSWSLEVEFSDGYQEQFSGHTTLQR